eukprot:2081072-Pleurochrysis_carterae.AAC.1
MARRRHGAGMRKWRLWVQDNFSCLPACCFTCRHTLCTSKRASASACLRATSEPPAQAGCWKNVGRSNGAVSLVCANGSISAATSYNTRYSTRRRARRKRLQMRSADESGSVLLGAHGTLSDRKVERQASQDMTSVRVVRSHPGPLLRPGTKRGCSRGSDTEPSFVKWRQI